jgi:hypothetical protein
MIAFASIRRAGRLFAMRRRALGGLAVAALALVLAGCGHKAAAPATTGPLPPPPAPPAPPPPPTLTSQSALEACGELQTNIRLVSQLISASVEEMTQSVHPKQLAKRTGDTRKNLLYSARVLEQIHPPPSLRASKRQLVAGLRAFAADFGKAQKAVEKDNLARAAHVLADPVALAKITASTTRIDRACGA